MVKPTFAKRHHDDDDDELTSIHGDEESMEDGPIDEGQENATEDYGSDGDNDELDSTSETQNIDDEREKQLQDELANIPFHQLLATQKKLSASQKVERSSEGTANSRSSTSKGKSQHYNSDEDENVPSWHRPEGIETSRPSLPKRANKNQPTEVTSKRAVPRHRQVVDVIQKKARDPRFESLSGEFRSDLFEQKYSFIREYEASEVNLIKQQAAQERDPAERDRLEKLVQRMISLEEARQIKDRRKKIERDWKKAEKEAVLKTGKNPYFLKKSDMKKLELVEKFESLKPGERERALERRRKKNASKEHRSVPYARRPE
ncbi:hypothetical protein SmJEL517_g03686 [Synchytrium microbalum]|uniref:rRNA biogenesis protein RRP36 n=1 Tax=Synchytrium microbalum TaxID=1806994 RepID=A0A507C124_9FUNG|nr:uncharacterized protein SmJEL517_g03686 [Synchytrium microbalum]TPX33402.1 hypothetical protein SmJEL517_g03686 [Synchytrium microbalum]